MGASSEGEDPGGNVDSRGGSQCPVRTPGVEEDPGGNVGSKGGSRWEHRV